jgi:hypothetical protein
MRQLTVVKSEHMGDWFCIEWAAGDHDGREWLEPTEYGHKFMRSARPSDACIEGPADEMLALANAIEAREAVEFRRCAVEVRGETVDLWSPRNSQTPAQVSLAVADALVPIIWATCGAVQP